MNEQSPCSFLGRWHQVRVIIGERLEFSTCCVLRSHRKSPPVCVDNNVNSTTCQGHCWIRAGKGGCLRLCLCFRKVTYGLNIQKMHSLNEGLPLQPRLHQGHAWTSLLPAPWAEVGVEAQEWRLAQDCIFLCLKVFFCDIHEKGSCKRHVRLWLHSVVF